MSLLDGIELAFMNNMNEAVNLVLFAFENANSGDLFIQKAPASTLETLAEAVIKLFNSLSTVKLLGVRHGEKMHETLMTTEESYRSEDLGDYFRIKPDGRDLNYGLYFEKGDSVAPTMTAYTSDNTKRLDVDQTIKKLLTVKEISDLSNSNYK
jgi:UDP-glucose 4-epimerase